MRTPLYRIQLYQRQGPLRRLLDRRPPRVEIHRQQPAPLEPDVEAHVLWHGGKPLAPEAPVTTARLPILMYHRIGDDGPAALQRFRVTPAAFEQQLAHLRARGYASVTLEEWQRAVDARKPLAGRRVLLTFDDAFRDFRTTAWPLLQRYGFSATVFVPTGHVGGTNAWDRVPEGAAPLLDWNEIRELAGQGARFGSHTVSHPMLTALPPTESARELLRARTELQRQLGQAVTSIAYPYGEVDAVVQSLAGATGHRFGLACEGRMATLHDPLLALPRLEVTGALDLAGFRRLLGEAPEPLPTAAVASATPAEPALA